MENKSFKMKLDTLLLNFIHIFEIIISIIIAIVIVFMIINLISSVVSSNLLSMETSEFSEFLSSALTLVVGLEFVKLLCHNTPENLIEVLMLAISRQMVVEHLNTYQMLFGIISIAVLLAAKKYFVDSKTEKN